MKNVLVYLHPSKCFDRESAVLARIQIDNSLDLGWLPDDIMLITNFPYEYNGIKSLVIDDNQFCTINPQSTKTVIIPHLFDLGLIHPQEFYWMHDFDACQLHPFNEASLNLRKDLGLTTYGYSSKWCFGSFFFNDQSCDIFQKIKNTMYQGDTDDERALRHLTKTGLVTESRYQTLNITYNFGMRHVAHNYGLADKPLKVLHFHPNHPKKGLRPLRIFMYGENELLIPLMDGRLIKLFQDHGVK